MSPRPAEIHANLDCVADGKAFSVRSSGRRIVVEVPDVATGLQLVRLGSPQGSLCKSIHQWKHFLDSALHQLEVRVRGHIVVAIGHGVGSRVWTLFGLPRIVLKPVVIGSLLLSDAESSSSDAER